MIRHILARIKRKPLEAAAVLLFTAVIALVLCGLHKGNEETQAQYEEIYETIDVRCTVTNLTGDQSDGLGLSITTIGLFTGTWERGSAELMEFVEDVQLKGSFDITWNGDDLTLVAITSTEIESELWPENGCAIFWNEGFDETVFGGGEPVCLIPQALAKKMQDMELPADSFPLVIKADYTEFQTDYDGTLMVAGTYSGNDDTNIYLPWDAYVAILRSCGRYEIADALHATLRDNREMDAFREAASQYFVEPDPDYAARNQVDGFYCALDINDYQLTQADLTLRNSMRVNELVTLLVFILAALAGFLTGFLVIRSRKREITLMRTLGCSNGGIYGEFALEQLVCILAGVLLGGGYTLWQPAGKLALFVAVNFAGLSAALVVFLRANLLYTMKEDE